MGEKLYRTNFQTGTIHYLGAYCPQARRMKKGNWKDFFTFGEAESELSDRDKIAKRCQRCGWPKNLKED